MNGGRSSSDLVRVSRQTLAFALDSICRQKQTLDAIEKALVAAGDGPLGADEVARLRRLLAEIDEATTRDVLVLTLGVLLSGALEGNTPEDGGKT